MTCYLLRAGETDKAKIGWAAADVEDRRCTLQAGCWERLILIRTWPGDRLVEAWLHRRFSRGNIDRDWFFWDGEMLTVEPPSENDLLIQRLRAPKTIDPPAISDIIGLWPTIETFAEDAGVPVSLVRVWKFRRSIPADRWSRIERAAIQKGIEGATASDLARLVSVEASA